MEKIIVFGVGNICRAFKECYSRSHYEIIALSDNNPEVWNKIQNDGIRIISPAEMIGMDYDRIVITTAHAYDIEKQLVSMGIEADKIISISSVEEIKKIRYNGRFELYRSICGEIETGNELAERNLFLSARIFADQIGKRRINNLSEAEFKVFSQFGEDGIIQWLINNVEIENKVFVEFGVSNYIESNTRFLLMNNNWSGLVMDGSDKDIAEIRNWSRLWLYDLEAKNCFITKDNINALIKESGIWGDIGILSVDIDGIDYWVLENISIVQPRIIICEYNNTFGNDYAVSVPYDETFDRTRKHYSNLYWGASLPAFRKLLNARGYDYVGSNSAGNNAFFVKREYFDISMISGNPEKEFVTAKYRESLDQAGKWSYLKGKEKLEVMKDMPLVDLEDGNRIKTIGEIFRIN